LKSINKPVSIHPHGVAYNKTAEGAHYNDGTSGTARLDDLVAQNSTINFTWQVPKTAGPGPNDPSTIGWMYHSHSDEIADPLAGLVGMIVIGNAGSMRALNGTAKLGTAKDVDKEVFYLFSVMNERASFMWPLNLATIEKRDAAVAASWLGTSAATPAPGAGRKLLQEAGEEEEEAEPSLLAMAEGEEVENDLMHGVNGYIYCNNPPLKVSRGDKVRFHVMAVGTEVDMHSATLAGSNFETDGQRGPAVSLLAGSMETSDVAVVAPAGPMVLGCRVADHIEAGMRTLILVGDTTTTTTSNTASTNNSTTRRPYFIQAEETLWSYAPKGRNFCGAEGPEPFKIGEAVFMEKIPGETIGSIYTKAVYRRYLNKNYIQRFPAPAFHGILGPVIAAEVGDVIEIYFKNTLNFEVNLKFDAGFVPLPESADVNLGVKTGETVKYVLSVPESAGPGNDDLNTVTYGYTSSIDEVYHPYSGLIGIALVGSKGAFAGLDPAAMPAEPSPAGVDGLLPLLLGVMNEGETMYLEKNAEDAGVDLTEDEQGRRRLLSGEAEAEAAAPLSPDFEESNLMHAINGFSYCNMPEIHVETGKVLRVASLGMGSEVDAHSVFFAGQSLVGGNKSPRGGLEPIMPASAMSVNIKATQPGKWVFECVVHDHSEAGMRAILSVDTPEEAKALAMGSSAVGLFGRTSAVITVFVATATIIAFSYL
jgi:hephaestin